MTTRFSLRSIPLTLPNVYRTSPRRTTSRLASRTCSLSSLSIAADTLVGGAEQRPWRSTTAAVGEVRSARGRPALVLAQVLRGDQLRVEQDHILLGLLAVEDAGREFEGLPGHHVRVLRRRCLDERVSGLKFRLDIRRSVDARDDELAPVQLLGREVDADRGRIVDGEDRVYFGETRQQALRHGESAVPRAFRILIVRQDLDVRVLFEHRFAALDPIDDRGDLRSIDDDDV